MYIVDKLCDSESVDVLHSKNTSTFARWCDELTEF